MGDWSFRRKRTSKVLLVAHINSSLEFGDILLKALNFGRIFPDFRIYVVHLIFCQYICLKKDYLYWAVVLCVSLRNSLNMLIHKGRAEPQVLCFERLSEHHPGQR